MQASQNSEQARLLYQVNQYIQAHQQAYAALKWEEQRRRGPCTLDHLLYQVMDYLTSETAQNGEATHASTTTLPFAIRDVPALARVATLQMRLSSTVMSALSTHPIITLFDLEAWVCAMEGVDHFIELGLGVGLQVLPVVQHYFHLRADSLVFPVCTQDVISFLLNDPGAREVLLYGGGDARDLLNRFSHFYERTVLAAEPTNATVYSGNNGGKESNTHRPYQHQTDSTVETLAGVIREPRRGARLRVLNVRQLGIHVQDYASFLARLAQDLIHCDDDVRRCASATAVTLPTSVSSDGAVMEAATARVRRFEQNRPLYERIVQSFDAACAESELAASMRRTRERATVATTCATEDARKLQQQQRQQHDKTSSCCCSSASPRGFDFAVECAEGEARLYAVPLTMWRNASLAEQPRGGVELSFHVGADFTERKVCSPRVEPSCAVGGSDGAANSAIPASTTTTTTTTATTTLNVNASTSAFTKAPAASPAPSPAASFARRRRGAVVSDVASCVPLEVSACSASTGPASAPADMAVAVKQPSAPSTADLLSALLRPAGLLGVTSAPPRGGPPATSTVFESAAALARADETAVKIAKAHVEADEKAGERAEKEEPTPIEQLHAYVNLDGNEELSDCEDSASKLIAEQAALQHVDRGIRLLEGLSAGDTVPLKLLDDVWRSMMRHARTSWTAGLRELRERDTMNDGDGTLSAFKLQWAHRRFIPLFSTSASGCANIGGAQGPVSRLASLRRQLSQSGRSGNSAGVPASAQAGSSRLLPSSDGANAKEIVYMAAPIEVCWTVWPTSSTDTSSSSCSSGALSLLLCACLEQHYSGESKALFCDFFSVRAAPSIAAWCTAACCARRVCTPALLTSDFTQRYLDSFMYCVDADVAARVADLSASHPANHNSLDVAAEQEKIAAALQAALDAVSDALPVCPLRAGVFPCDHAWRCGLDGLLFASPRLCGYNGVLLTPFPAEATSASSSPPLRVLCFTMKKPSWAATAVLRYFGVVSLEDVVETRVHFSSTVNTHESGALHEKIAAIAPYMQGFCRSRFPQWYALAYPILQQRLKQLRVVLTAADASSSPRQLLRLYWNGFVYAYERDIRLEYVAAHNVLFGSAEDYAVPMLTEALLPLFSPVAMTTTEEEHRLLLRDVLAALLAALSSLRSAYADFEASPESQRQRQAELTEVLMAVARDYRFEPYHLCEQTQRDAEVVPFSRSSSLLSASAGGAGVEAELPFALSTRPFARFQSSFPPGTDALRQPRGPLSSTHGAVRKLTQEDAASLASARRGLEVANGTAGGRVGGPCLAVRHRLGADDRLRVTLTLPGSGGETALVTSQPAWVEFALQPNVNSIVADCSDKRRQIAKEADLQPDTARPEYEVSDDGEEAASNCSTEESFLTFQYHRRKPLVATGALSQSSLAAARKRSRDSAADHADEVNRGANWWLRPPASSDITGSAGDTPDYAVAAERYVYALLCTEYAEQMKQHGVRVIWVNEFTEAGSPFDILVVRPRPSTFRGQNGRGREAAGKVTTGQASQWDVVSYVEVKSTCTANRQDFELSLSELLFAARFGAAYKVYRVFGASTDKLRRMRCTVYADVVQMWYRAELTITSDIRVTPSK